MSSAHQNTVSKHKDGHNGSHPDFQRDFKDLSKATSAIATDAAQMVQENATEYYDKGVLEVKKMKMGIQNRIQEHPVQSLLIVAGVGLLLGTLWNRR